MHPPLLISKFCFFMINIISLILILDPQSVYANDGNFSSCSARFHCGDIQDIGYPFWGLDRPESCGYPGFRLNCNENDEAEITIMSATYRVLGINNDTQMIRVARTDYSENICPTHLINSTFNSSFAYNRDIFQEIRLYYGCQLYAGPENITEIQASGFFNQFECSINESSNSNSNMIGYYVTKDISQTYFGSFVTVISSFLGSCQDSVNIPVLDSEVGLVEANRNSETLREALREGFDLKWSANDSFCSPCMESRGQCGYNLTSLAFICYCSNGAYPEICPQTQPDSNGNNNKIGLPLGLGFAGAVLAGIALAMICLRCRQHRKKIADQKSRDLLAPPSGKGTSTSTTNTSQSNESIPPYPTPKYDRDLEKGSTYFGVHVFSYEELEQATDNFNPSKELGEGGFGTVYYGVLNDGRVVAVKRLYESNCKRVDQYMNEIEILTRIRHPNLVTLYGCTSRRSRELLLVYEYIPNGTVADHLHGKLVNTGLLTWPVRLSIAVETANALAYLHATDIIHRDVKTNNILLDKKLHVKVADFGLSRLFPNDVTHVSTAPQGTPGYVDPEYYQCYKLTEKSDVYSFGVVLIELISAKQAVDTNRHRHDINLANMAVSRIQKNALQELVDPSLGFDKDYTVKGMITSVAELAFRCLQQEREVRPSMKEVLDVLKGIQNKEELGVVQKAEVVDINPEAEAEMVDIRSDDVGLLKHNVTPPDSATDKWMQIRSM